MTIRYVNQTVYSDFSLLNDKVDLVYAASSLNSLTGKKIIEGDSVRILCLGNSLTIFPRCDSIGWHCSHGMAASKIENDYVHVLERRLNHRRDIKNASVIPLDIRGWERNFNVDKDSLIGSMIKRNDIVVIRIGENVSKSRLANFRAALEKLIDYCEKHTDKIIITGVYNPDAEKDAILKAVAVKHHHPFIPLSWIKLMYRDYPNVGDTIYDDENIPFTIKEEGVITNHPGDETMMLIANAIEIALR
ncbi:MAG: hypothetical protein NC102_05010 [Clostridium sp.]|nr:hypothetical protein [Clostridium sp.]